MHAICEKKREREIEDQPAPIFRSRERRPWLPSCFLGVFLGVDTVAGSASRSIFLYSAAAEPSTASGDPSTPARGLDDDGRAQLPPWLLRSSRRAGGARRRLHLRWIEMGWGAPRPWLLNRPLLPLPEEKPLAWRCVGFL